MGMSLPTRVLDVTSNKVRLIETSRERGAYIALSYCWGDEPFINTTKSRLQDRKEGITFGNLPKTFQDAVIITRKLGIKYLWIDSLCIIQDSTEDWAEESAMMADVYENSYLTIAAASATSVHSGLFFYERDNEQRDREIRCTAPSGRALSVTTRVSKRHELLDRNLPLFQRGWAYQERLLAPRTLYCCKSELCWECREGFDCECGLIKVDCEGQKPEKKAPGTFTMDCQQSWHSTVANYSKLALTYGTDKLPALSGLAKQMALITSDDYLAGLWRQTLQTDMLWEVSWDGKRPEKFRAPTWSWASTEGEITFLDSEGPQKHIQLEQTFQSSWELLDVHYSMLTSNPYGEVRSASLIISGQLLPATLRYNWDFEDDEDIPLASADKYDNQLHAAEARLRSDNKGEPDSFEVEIGQNSFYLSKDYNLSAPGRYRVNDGERIWLFWAASNVENEIEVLLILRSVKSEGEERKMERIGILSTDQSTPLGTDGSDDESMAALKDEKINGRNATVNVNGKEKGAANVIVKEISLKSKAVQKVDSDSDSDSDSESSGDDSSTEFGSDNSWFLLLLRISG
jgi:hypothetical protein